MVDHNINGLNKVNASASTGVGAAAVARQKEGLNNVSGIAASVDTQNKKNNFGIGTLAGIAVCEAARYYLANV